MKRRSFNFHLLFVASVIFLVSGTSAAKVVSAANLLTNGNFNLGNTGFQSDYTTPFTNNVNDQTTPGHYAVGPNPYLICHLYFSFAPVPGSTNMLFADGSTTANQYIWQQSVSNLTPGAQYNFSGYLASINIPTEGNPALIQLFADGNQFGNSAVAPVACGVWTTFSDTFTASSTSEVFQIVDNSLQYGGNDFALDDLSLQQNSPAPEASTFVGILLGVAGLVVFGFYRRQTSH